VHYPLERWSDPAAEYGAKAVCVFITGNVASILAFDEFLNREMLTFNDKPEISTPDNAAQYFL